MKTSTPEAPKPVSPLKILLIGPPGAYKTTFMLQFPGVHVMDCDHNLDGPSLFLRKNGHSDLSFTYDDIRLDDDGRMIDIYECYDRLIDKLQLFRSDPAYKNRQVVAVDSLSHVNEFIIRKILKMKAKDSMDPNHWTDFKSYAYSLLVAKLEQTAKTIICVCHELTLTKADAKQIMVQEVIGYEPFFQGKVGDMIGAFFTDVWRMSVQQASGGRTESIIRTQAMPLCQHLKNSMGMPPEINITKGYSAIAQYMEGRI